MTRKQRRKESNRQTRRILNRSRDTLKITGNRLGCIRYGEGLTRNCLSRDDDERHVAKLISIAFTSAGV
jgi:hypothetical protein